jgi:hypothetical protein
MCSKEHPALNQVPVAEARARWAPIRLAEREEVEARPRAPSLKSRQTRNCTSVSAQVELRAALEVTRGLLSSGQTELWRRWSARPEEPVGGLDLLYAMSVKVLRCE